ncbi:imidazoleglycerol-phosphate dehydratase HisB [Candidatus Margulisiibacteriota bacterium]
MKRKAEVKRKTKETDINLSLIIDGSGKSNIKTGIPFFDHMLTLFAKHGIFDLKLTAKGDIEVDYHHTVEDVGICLGQAVKKALGKKAGIERFGEGKARVPMDESLAEVSIDISGRPHLTYNVKPPASETDKFSIELVEEFFNAFMLNAGVTVHVDLIRGKNSHHMKEAIFKAFAVALSRACQISPRKKGVPSTKGTL